MNTYGYVKGNPANHRDPLGLWNNPTTGRWQQKPKKKKPSNKKPKAKRDDYDDAAEAINDEMTDDESDSEYLYVEYCILARCYYDGECGSNYRDFRPGEWLPCGTPKKSELPDNCVCLDTEVVPYEDEDNLFRNIIKSRGCDDIRNNPY